MNIGKLALALIFIVQGANASEGFVRTGEGGPTPRGTALDVKEMAETSSIRTCISSEGIHLIKRTKGRIRSHLYMGFGYEVEPTCTAKELQ
jgi:hypothetical protein